MKCTTTALVKMKMNTNLLELFLKWSTEGLPLVPSCTCIIHQVFAGILQSNVTCLTCQNVTTASDPILDISLDIKGFASNYSTLAECLEKYTRPEKLGANEYSCGLCGNNAQESTKQLSIKKLPTVLSIQLKVQLTFICI